MISTLLYILYINFFFYKDAINDCLHNKKKTNVRNFYRVQYIIYNSIAL